MGNTASGAKDFNAFVRSASSGYLPRESSITHEGVFYKYYFETGEELEKELSINYGFAISRDPFSDNREFYMGLELNSKYDGEGLKKFGGRPLLNLVIVLDVSGSMSCTFGEKDPKSKLEVAKEVLTILLDHLNPKDKFGLVLFSDQAIVVQNLTQVSSIDMQKLKKTISQFHTIGGTNFGAGIIESTEMLKKRPNPNTDTNENRIFFITDAHPTVGEQDSDVLLNMMKSNANDHRIFTTLVGVGFDFNTQLVDYISKIRASNYFSVLTAADFRKQMEEFDYFVTPFAYNIEVKFESPMFMAERVYGSPGSEYAKEPGELMSMNSVFPSPKSSRTETKGGIVLVKLINTMGSDPAAVAAAAATKSVNPIVKLTLSYDDRMGFTHKETTEVEFPIQYATGSEDFFKGSAVRKAILLTRFVNLMKLIIRTNGREELDMKKHGIIPPPVKTNNDELEHSGGVITEKNKAILEDFIKYFEKEASEIKDNILFEEVKIMKDLAK